MYDADHWYHSAIPTLDPTEIRLTVKIAEATPSAIPHQIQAEAGWEGATHPHR